MKFGINLWNWSNDPSSKLETLIYHVSDLGFQAVELPLFNTQAWDLKSIKRALAETGLELSFCARQSDGLDGSSPDETTRRQTIDYLAEGLCLGGDLEAKVLAGPFTGGSGKRHFLPPDEARAELDRGVDSLKELASLAESTGVRLALEPINRYRTSVVNTVSQALAVIERVNSPAVGLLFDTYQANIEEADPFAALETALKAGKLFHFHASENHRGAPGSGHINWQTYAEILRQNAYEGHITMETFVAGGLDSGFLDTPEPDIVARSGLQHLRKNFH